MIAREMHLHCGTTATSMLGARAHVRHIAEILGHRKLEAIIVSMWVSLVKA
jgi:hypothetical protein